MSEVDVSRLEWTAGSALYGSASIYEGKEVVSLKILSDRCREGGGIAYLVKFTQLSLPKTTSRNIVDVIRTTRPSPELALTGPSQMSVTCPLSGEKRTLSKSRLTIRGGQPPSLDGGQVSRPHFAL
jgi:hypothetical protein